MEEQRTCVGCVFDGDWELDEGVSRDVLPEAAS
jgi:hypothetical protein